jgi:hypothetical protein
MSNSVLSLTLSFALATVTPFAAAGCLPIVGTVKLSPDATCTVASFPGLQGQPFIGECFTVALKLGNLVPANGHAGVTSEMITSSLDNGGLAASPATVQDKRAVLTARSTFTLAGTRFYAAEVIIDSGNGNVTEQSIITGTDGKGLFKNAQGTLNILGNSIGETAQVRGKICTP